MIAAKDTNEIVVDDIPKLCAVIYGNFGDKTKWTKVKAAQNVYRHFMDKCLEKLKTTLTFEDFREVIMYHGTFMYPIYEMQRTIREKVNRFPLHFTSLLLNSSFSPSYTFD
jgi:hypothetical protein